MGIETVALVVSAVVAAGSAAYSSYVANDNAIDAEKAAEKQAAMEEEAAKRDAANIRDKAARLKSAQAAALAGSGARIDSGTGSDLLGETTRLSEQDALLTLREGSQRADLVRMGGGITAGNLRGRAIAESLNGVTGILNGVTNYQRATKGSSFAAQMNMGTDKLYTQIKPKYSLLGGAQ